MLEYIDRVYPEIAEQIESRKTLEDELTAKIIKAAKEFREQYQ